MSYILDALRRSQAERDRGQVPGLDAQPGAGAPPPPAPRRLTWPWLLLGGLVTVAAVVALVLWRSSPAVPGVPPPAATHRDLGAAAPVPVAALPAPAPSTFASTAAAAPAQMPMVVSVPTPTPEPTLPVPVPVPPPALPAAARPVAPPGAAASAGATIPLAQLTPAQRRELPALAISGSIWSESAANRFVMVNGQVVREGEAAAPGVVVERIGPKTLWLRWRALRIEMPL